MNKKIIAIIFPILVTLIASLFSSEYPDILKTFITNYCFTKQAQDITSLFMEYSLSFINNKYMSTFFSGVIGLILLYILYSIVGRVIRYFSK
jgi:uncharacterized membrane protein